VDERLAKNDEMIPGCRR